jgi:hypothetical protein
MRIKNSEKKQGNTVLGAAGRVKLILSSEQSIWVALPGMKPGEPLPDVLVSREKTTLLSIASKKTFVLGDDGTYRQVQSREIDPLYG